ncbi:MAG: hypothetical protein JW969_03800, partial [Spirochaetales bacterium]|nr:hypothetical protein [Spirochaetales bacterium]
TLLGYYEDEIDFNDAFMKFHVDPDKVQDELESKMEKTRRHYSYLEKLTAHRVVDFNLDAFYDTTKKERLVNNALIQEMVEEYARLEDSDLLIRKGKGISAPVILQKGNTGSYTGFFDSKTAIEHPEKDFFAFGHPFIDHACSRMRETSFLGLTAAVKMDMENPACSSEGVIFNFIVSFKGSRVSEHLIPVYVDLQTALEFDDSRTVADEFLKFRFKESNVAEHAPIPEQLWERLYTKALLWIELEIKTRLDEVQKNLDQQIGTTLPLINRHYDGIFAELEEILQLQKSKEKIYSIPAMKGLITRTENKIRRFKKLKETEMERMVKMKTIHTTYTLLSLALMKINGSL